MVVLLSLLLWLVAEIWAAVVVAQWIGALATALLLVGLSLLGVLLVRSEGLAVWRRVNEELAAGRVPTDTVLDGLLVLLGGLLLIVPGFVTAVPGLALLFPPTRAVLRPWSTRWVARRAERSAGLGGITFGAVSFGGVGAPNGPDDAHRRGSVIDADSHDASPGRSRSGPYAEVVDVEVDRPGEIGPAR